MADQSGRVFLITGASSGIGAATARALLASGATVIALARDTDKAHRVLGDDPRLEVRRLDLADPSSVRAVADDLDRDIDVLINNAGVMGAPSPVTVATNHLGPFALTALLLPRVRDRVVAVSSVVHWYAALDLADLHGAKLDPNRAYWSTKLMNLLFTFELQRRLTAAGSSVRALAAHPGVVATNLGHGAAPGLLTSMATGSMKSMGQTAEQGAAPILLAATADLPGGTFVGPGGFFGFVGSPRVKRPRRLSRDPELARRLWELSEAETGVQYAFA